MTRRIDVRETYDRIAWHFAKTRREPWPEVESFIEGHSGAVALDVGTGNGRHAELLAARVDCVLATDLSRAALDTAISRAGRREYSLAPIQSDAAELPLRSATVDLAVYVATLHHLPSRELRIRSLAELNRVLAPGSYAIISAWSVSHEQFNEDTGFDTTVDWTLPDGEKVPRYYHIYDMEEFEADVEDAGLVHENTFETTGNCYAIVTTGA